MCKKMSNIFFFHILGHFGFISQHLFSIVICANRSDFWATGHATGVAWATRRCRRTSIPGPPPSPASSPSAHRPQRLRRAPALPVGFEYCTNSVVRTEPCYSLLISPANKSERGQQHRDGRGYNFAAKFKCGAVNLFGEDLSFRLVSWLRSGRGPLMTDMNRC